MIDRVAAGSGQSAAWGRLAAREHSKQMWLRFFPTSAPLQLEKYIWVIFLKFIQFGGTAFPSWQLSRVKGWTRFPLFAVKICTFIGMMMSKSLNFKKIKLQNVFVYKIVKCTSPSSLQLRWLHWLRWECKRVYCRCKKNRRNSFSKCTIYFYTP